MRLIDVDALIERMATVYTDTDRRAHYDEIMRAIREQPTVDAVPVVRCKDCKYAPTNLGAVCSPENIKWGDSHCFEGEDSEGCPYNCGDPWYSIMPEPYWYCWKGKRKEQ